MDAYIALTLTETEYDLLIVALAHYRHGLRQDIEKARPGSSTASLASSEIARASGVTTKLQVALDAASATPITLK